MKKNKVQNAYIVSGNGSKQQLNLISYIGTTRKTVTLA